MTRALSTASREHGCCLRKLALLLHVAAGCRHPAVARGLFGLLGSASCCPPPAYLPVSPGILQGAA